MNSRAFIGPRLREARLLLGLNQTQFANESGLYQADISDMERLEKTHIAVAYLAFLYRKGIDLHTLFGAGPVALRTSVPITAKEKFQSATVDPLAPYGAPPWLAGLLERVAALEGKEKKKP